MSLTTPHQPQHYSDAWQKKPLRHLLDDGSTVIKNAGLKCTSAWLNTFSHKDHHGKRKEQK